MATLTLSTERLAITPPRLDQAAAMLDFAVRNRDHLKPWNPPAPEGLYTLTHWQEVAVNSALAFDARSAVRLWVATREHPERIIGSIGYSQISRSPFCACVLGYQIDHACEGQGMMAEALQATNRYMFDEQKLHRIAANYRPENKRSGQLLANLGFRIEGYARDYLFIDGAWRDHILTSLTNHAFDTNWLKVTAKL